MFKDYQKELINSLNLTFMLFGVYSKLQWYDKTNYDIVNIISSGTSLILIALEIFYIYWTNKTFGNPKLEEESY